MSDPISGAFDARSLATLAQQLHDGPLQELTELQRKTALLSTDTSVDEHERLRRLTELALVSLSAMEHFHAFTRELRAQIAAITVTPARDIH
jgi:signal transduction histidine kinase